MVRRSSPNLVFSGSNPYLEKSFLQQKLKTLNINDSQIRIFEKLNPQIKRNSRKLEFEVKFLLSLITFESQ